MAKTTKEEQKPQDNELVNEQETIVSEENESPENEQDNTSPDDLDGLRELLARKEAEIENQKSDYLRLMAEFDNFRKRTQREKAALIEYAASETVTALLPVLDDFKRAISVMDQTDNLTSIKEGVSMVSDKFSKILTSKGMTEIEAKGIAFNSAFHEAIASVPAGEDKVGLVIDEVEKGYMLKDKVIRYSKVIVGE
jgi:molecular chaperone GrpE